MTDVPDEEKKTETPATEEEGAEKVEQNIKYTKTQREGERNAIEGYGRSRGKEQKTKRNGEAKEAKEASRGKQKPKRRTRKIHAASSVDTNLRQVDTTKPPTQT